MIKELKEKLFVSMTVEQEKGYVVSCAERILRYDWIFLFIIMAIQIYNIGYTLLYTKGRLHTISSRVYTVLYVVLLAISVCALFLSRRLRKHLPDNAKSVVYFQVGYCVFLLLWGACITVYDQRVSENISVYLIISLSVAVLAYFTPLQAIFTYGVFQCALLLTIPIFKTSSKDSYGEAVNLTVMTLMAIFICIYRYCSDRKHYLNQQIIKEKNSHLNYLANRDFLTGLRNRRFLENEMERLYRQCICEKMPMTVMMMDIDSFKAYNDRFGHIQGDECLRRTAWRLSQELDGESEYLIRYGGEEFLYVGIGVDPQSAIKRGEYFNKIVRELIIGPSNQDPRGVTISVGTYTTAVSEDRRWSEYIEHADKALYQAKNGGKDQCVCLSDMKCD